MRKKVILLVLAFLLAGCLLWRGGQGWRVASDAELTIVHLTDLHLSTVGRVMETPWTHKVSLAGYRLHQPCTGCSLQLLSQALDVIRERVKPDVVVITGDVLDRGNDRAALEKAGSMIRKLPCPVVVLQGDHDRLNKKADRELWQAFFGPMDGSTTVKGVPVVYLPFEKNEAVLARFRQSVTRVGDGSLSVLGLHRMLEAPALMDHLAKAYHGCSVLDPDQNAVRAMLHATKSSWLVLCGHSHTENARAWENVMQLCTPSLAEYPHAFRVVRIRGGRVTSELVRVDGDVRK